MQTCRKQGVLKPAFRNKAFSVAELLVSVAMMSVIVIALYSVFNQTQKALRASITQVDVSGSARAALELISRDLEGISATMDFSTTNLQVNLIPAGSTPVSPIVQEDLDGKPLRTNYAQQVFGLVRDNKQWTGIGYIVLSPTNSDGTFPPNAIGVLARYATNVHANVLGNGTLVNGIQTISPQGAFTEAVTGYYVSRPDDPRRIAAAASLHAIVEGVVHFRVKPYDAAGRPWNYGDYPIYYPTNLSQYTRTNLNGVAQEWIWLHARTNPWPHNVTLSQETRNASGGYVLETASSFTSNALPAYLELELGVIEPDVMRQYNALRDSPGSASANFLRKHAAQVQVFRRRIPIRTATQ